MVERSDTSRRYYPKAVFMTIFALHPETTIRGWLLSEGGYYKDRGYSPVKYGMYIHAHE